MIDENPLSDTDPSPENGSANRRSFARHACGWTVSCYTVLPEDENRWPGTISNVSHGGLSLVACRPFQEGEVIALELVRHLDGFREKLLGRIQHVSNEGNVWVAGCRFLKRLSDEELECLRLVKTPIAVERVGHSGA